MKKSKQLIISKTRYVGHVQQVAPDYIRLTDAGHEWVSNPNEATKFPNSSKAVEFLNSADIDGATIEPEPKPKLFKAQFIDVGRSHVNKDFFFNDTKELHKEIGKYILSKGWGLTETETEGTWIIESGVRTTGTIIITDVKPIENEKAAK